MATSIYVNSQLQDPPPETLLQILREGVGVASFVLLSTATCILGLWPARPWAPSVVKSAAKSGCEERQLF